MPEFWIYVYMLAGGLQEHPEFEPTGRLLYRSIPPDDAEKHWRQKFNIHDNYFPVKVVRVSEDVANFLLRHHLASEAKVLPTPEPFAPPPLNKPGDTTL